MIFCLSIIFRLNATLFNTFGGLVTANKQHAKFIELLLSFHRVVQMMRRDLAVHSTINAVYREHNFTQPLTHSLYRQMLFIVPACDT